MMFSGAHWGKWSPFETVEHVLQLSVAGASKTQIMAETHFNYAESQRYIDKLIGMGLLEARGELHFTTATGFDFLKLIERKALYQDPPEMLTRFGFLMGMLERTARLRPTILHSMWDNLPSEEEISPMELERFHEILVGLQLADWNDRQLAMTTKGSSFLQTYREIMALLK